ncbi:MAG: rhomboid family intramembrane serine protease [Bradymonadia bacterium]
MSEQKYKLLVLWYRLTGASQVQAEWKARRALDQAEQSRANADAQVARVVDRRFKCLCGQLLTADQKVCHACGRKQRMPHWARGVTRALGLVVPDVAPATIFIMAIIVLGYGIQIRVGGGGIFDPVAEQNPLTNFHLGAYLGPERWRQVRPFIIALNWDSPTFLNTWWRSISYAFLHGDLMHIGFNSLALFQVGPLIEERFGAARVLFAWVITSIGAVMLPPLIGIAADTVVIGASGAVFGLIGMAMLQGHRDGDARGRMIREVMIRWTVIATLFGVLMTESGGSRIAHSAHFGGLAVGATLTLLLPPPDDRPARRALSPILGTAGMAILVLALYQFWNFFQKVMAT